MNKSDTEKVERIENALLVFIERVSEKEAASEAEVEALPEAANVLYRIIVDSRLY